MAARKAAAAQESKRAGYDIPAESIYLTSGASSSLSIVLSALVSEGEKVAVLAPFFPEYKVFAENAGAEILIVPPAGDDMQPFMAAFENAVEQGVAAVIINSPNNPSGAILSEQTLRVMSKILQAAQEKKGKAFTSLPTSLTASLFTATLKFRLCRISIQTRSFAIPIQSPCRCRASASAI